MLVIHWRFGRKVLCPWFTNRRRKEIAGSRPFPL